MTLDEERFRGFARARQPRSLGPDEEHLSVLRENVERYGWHVQAVLPDPGRIGWQYTVGFGDSIGHPELVVSGVPQEVGQVLLNDIGDALAEGRRFEVGERYPDFLVDVDIELRPTLARWNEAHFGRARDWYGEFPPTLQVVLPDRENRFPGEPDSDAGSWQLLLFDERPTPRYLSHERTPIDVEEVFRAIVPDLLGEHPSGWEEELLVVRGANADRWVVVSVPYVDHIGFGDELELHDTDGRLELTAVTARAPIATARVLVLRGGDDTRQRLDAAAARARRGGHRVPAREGAGADDRASPTPVPRGRPPGRGQAQPHRAGARVRPALHP